MVNKSYERRHDRSATLYIRCDPELRDELAQLAKHLKVDASDLVRDAAQAVVQHGCFLRPFIQGLKMSGVDDAAGD